MIPTHLNIQEKRISQFFKLGVSLKGAHAVIEIISGLILLLVPLSVFTQLAVWLTKTELLEDSNDFIANYLLNFSNQLSLNTIIFGGVYLLSHGLIKIVLVVGLLKNKLWAYPWSLAVLGLFILYQVYRFAFTHSIALVLLTIFDLVVMWLIWREYQIVKK